ncbi:hypothetical protein BLOT_014199 [Blomia tropicalis]|nr:hypothetical protein BLOT_014199 [Blomia tropicalis]
MVSHNYKYRKVESMLPANWQFAPLHPTILIANEKMKSEQLNVVLLLLHIKNEYCWLPNSYIIIISNECNSNG